MRLIMLLIASWIVTGCATNIPAEIRKPVAGAPSLPEVAADAGAFQGQQVRWGGTVVNVRNEANTTVIEVLARRLDAFGEPFYTDRSEGRFLARYNGFLDPKIYDKDRRITVYGSVTGNEVGKVGEHPYTYPVLEADQIYLWPQRLAMRGDPWCRDSYWGSSFRYRHYPFSWHRHRWGYWHPWGDPFWGYGPSHCW